MERALNMEDRMRKAEEIYYRRNNSQMKDIKEINKKTIKKSFIKKITVQTLVSACIFTGVFAFLNNVKYSEMIKSTLEQILDYNIDFQGFYQRIFNENTQEIDEGIIINAVEDVMEETNQKPEETLGVVEKNIDNEEVLQDDPIDVMAEDARYIRENYSIIKPLDGVITSRFGMRENVEPLYHTGIDIAADTGTTIVAAMDGVAEIVSSEGSYGKHIKITNGEVSSLYAHCSVLNVQEGDYIKQGEKIAEVGSTGNATGPHLHFEIMRNGGYVNPDLILDF